VANHLLAGTPLRAEKSLEVEALVFGRGAFTGDTRERSANGKGATLPDEGRWLRGERSP
jgi:hypothetical protein